MAASSISALMLPRVAGALALRTRTFAEVAGDPMAAFQAAFLVVLVGVCEGAVHAQEHGHASLGGDVLFLSLLAAIIGWLLWSAVVYVVGRIFRHRRDFASVTRGIGFAHAPSLLFGLTLLPVLGMIPETLRTISLVWFVGAVYAAVRGIFSLPAGEGLRLTGACLVGRLLLEAVIKIAGA